MEYQHFDFLGQQFPAQDMHARGFVCIPIPISGVPFLLGALQPLAYPYLWNGTPEDIKRTVQQFTDLLAALTLLETCDVGESAQVIERIIQVCAGGAEMEEIKRMVSKVYIDYETGELVVIDGQCCEQRFALAGSVGIDVWPEDGEDLFFELPDYDPAPDYTACAKAARLMFYVSSVVDTLLDEGVATDPYTMANHVKQEYPAINFGSIALFTAAVAAINISLQGKASETENDDFQKTVRADWSRNFSDGAEGITKAQYETALSNLVSRAGSYFSPILFPTSFGSMTDLWYQVLKAIGPGDAKKLTTAIAETGAEDCAEGAAPGELVATPPDVNGWFLSAPWDDIPTHIDDYWSVSANRYLAVHDIYGVVLKITFTGTAGQIKQMSYGSTEQGGNALPQPEVSLTKDSSAHYETNHQAGVPFYLVLCDDQGICDSVMEQLGVDVSDYVRDNLATGISAAGETTTATASKVVGVRIDWRNTMDTMVITEVRFLHNLTL